MRIFLTLLIALFFQTVNAQTYQQLTGYGQRVNGLKADGPLTLYTDTPRPVLKVKGVDSLGTLAMGPDSLPYFFNGITWNPFITGSIDTTSIPYFSTKVRSLFSGVSPITYSNGAIGITQATSGSAGYLSSSDWNAFNSRTPGTRTLTITGTAPISITPTGAQDLSTNRAWTVTMAAATSGQSGYLSASDWATFNSKQSALTTGNLTETGSSVLTITGGTGAQIGTGTTIQVKQASSTQSGFLSNTDWTIFNSKGTVSSVALSMPSIFSVSGTPITTSGILAATLTTQNSNTVFAGPTTGTAAAPTFRTLVAADIPSGSGNYIQNQSAAAQSGSLWINNSAEVLGLITTVPPVNGSGNSSWELRTSQSAFNNMNSRRWSFAMNTLESGSNSGSDFNIYRYSDGGALLRPAIFIQRSTGNIGIDTTLPATKLDINGSVRAQIGFVHTIVNATDANFIATTGVGDMFILPVVTASRTFSFSAAVASWLAGQEILIWNKNTSAFTWTVTGSVGLRDSAGTTVTTLTNQKIYSFIYDGTNLVIKSIQ